MAINNVSVQYIITEDISLPRYYTVDPMLLPPSGNITRSKCHEVVLFLEPMIPPKRFDIVFPLTEGCSEGLDALVHIFLSKQYVFSPSLLRKNLNAAKPPE